MKVGDYVAWAGTQEDETGSRPAGIILEARHTEAEWGYNFSEFLILVQHNGKLSWEFGSDLEVMFESR